MRYRLEIKQSLYKKLSKYIKKNQKLYLILDSKISQILDNPYHFKPLKGNMSGLRRVHIAKSFVLTYEIIEKDELVILIDFEHHDKVYISCFFF